MHSADVVTEKMLASDTSNCHIHVSMQHLIRLRLSGVVVRSRTSDSEVAGPKSHQDHCQVITLTNFGQFEGTGVGV